MDNNVNETTEYLNEETEILEPFVDTTNIVPVAPPVAVAPPKVEEEVLNATTEAPVSNMNENVGVQAVPTEVPTQPVVEQPVSVEAKVEEGSYQAGEPLKEVIVGEEKSSPLKYIFTIILFIVLGGSIIFMPEINDYIKRMEFERNNATQEKIMTGFLKCEYSRSSENLDMNFSYKFSFDDNKFKKLTFISETRGDANLDAQELEGLNNECLTLKTVTEDIKGIAVDCNFTTDTVTKTQVLDYSEIDVQAAYSAYSEAGGVYPDYNYLEDMDKIEKNMKAAGYTCERIK